MNLSNMLNLISDNKLRQHFIELWEAIQKQKSNLIEITYKNGPLEKDRFVNFEYRRQESFEKIADERDKITADMFDGIKYLSDKKYTLETFLPEDFKNFISCLFIVFATSDAFVYSMDKEIYGVIHKREFLKDSIDYIKLKSIPFRDRETVSGGVKVTITIKYK